MILLLSLSSVFAAKNPAAADFHEKIAPILSQYCSDCHEDGESKGGVTFDNFKSDDALLASNKLWFAVLKNLRAGLMPPPNKSRPTGAENAEIEKWIKYGAFGIDPARPDPGRVTVRRLNRVEYHNTIHDLLGVDYDTETEFPPDDAGYGFDDIGDVLTLPPMLLEKYLDAARTIIGETVPTTPWVMPEKMIPGYRFDRVEPIGTNNAALESGVLSYYEKGALTNYFHAEHAGTYRLNINLAAHEHFVDGQFDYNKCRLTLTSDGKELFRKEYMREENKALHYSITADWSEGDHSLVFAMESLTPNVEQVRSLSMRVEDVTVAGPLNEKFWIHPQDYARFFPKEVPKSAGQRRVYAREVLGSFVSRAFRRPVDDGTLDRLVKLAEEDYKQPGKTFEAGIANAIVAVLVSPRFLFREEAVAPHHPAGQPLIDEYSLASRLSYFLWSSMPDDELIRLARDGNLRANLPAQVKRMLADHRSEALSRNFTGQWLQARDIETVSIDGSAVTLRDEKPDPQVDVVRTRFWELKSIPEAKRSSEQNDELEKLREVYFKNIRYPRSDLTEEVRKSMHAEVEMYFEHIVRRDCDVIELVDSDYTYLNGRLAKHYGLTNLDVHGPDLRRVDLPQGCERGGVLTMGAVLAVTSNPTRTSPVKRGLFVLDNILGNPTPPPPPNIPPLENSEKELAGKGATLREVLAIHRDKPMCNSCHGRMDPIGLAFEHFNALGLWRDSERGTDIDASGKLATGETFKDARELKHILATNHRVEFYRTLTEKLLTYALGRGLEYSDVETVDQIVDRLQKNDGHFSALLYGIIESAPFQMRREGVRFAESGVSGRAAN